MRFKVPGDTNQERKYDSHTDVPEDFVPSKHPWVLVHADGSWTRYALFVWGLEYRELRRAKYSRNGELLENVVVKRWGSQWE